MTFIIRVGGSRYQFSFAMVCGGLFKTPADALLTLQTNYSQLYTTFWDRALGTMWEGEADALEKRYRGVTAVDVGGKWVEWFGKNEVLRQELRDRKPKLA